MHFASILRVLGALLMMFSITMLVPVVVSLYYMENNWLVFVEAFLTTFVCGGVTFLGGQQLNGFGFRRRLKDGRADVASQNNLGSDDLGVRDGFLITSMFWFVLGIFGCLPIWLSDALDVSLTNAIFESISGLTTTGATVLVALDELPRSILFYRQQLQWLGGIGIIVIAVAVLPMLGVGGMQLYRAETPGPVKDSKLTPRITGTAKALFQLYLLLTIACVISYWAAGMGWFDAIAHGFSTISIGGFSTHDQSMGYFDSRAISAIAMFFMLIAGVNFALHFFAWRSLLEWVRIDDLQREEEDGSPRRVRYNASKPLLVQPTLIFRQIVHSVKRVRPLIYLKDPELGFYVLLIFSSIALVVGSLLLLTELEWSEALVQGSFQVISIATTTGFANANFSAWPSYIPFLLIGLSFAGACAGSTGGGLKIIRVLLMVKQGLREIKQLVHPHAVIPLKLGRRTVQERVMFAVWGFVAIYILTFFVLSMVLMGLGSDFITAISATAASLNNLGPGLGEVAAHYANLNNPSKWVLCFSMLLGRLEIFTLLVLFTPAFWRK